MPQISVRVEGAEIVRAGLEDLAAETPLIARRRMRWVLERIKRRMQEYPPERKNFAPGRRTYSHSGITVPLAPRTQKYVRTGRLGNHWAIDQIENGYVIYNDAARRSRRYGKYVVGDAYGLSQAWMHKGRWPLLRDVTEEEIAKLPEVILDDIVIVERRYELA